MQNQKEVVVTELKKDQFAQQVITGEHKFLVDEPLDKNGHDLGPSPYDLLLAALGSCTSMTIRMYATRHQIPLEKITVKLQHEKIHAKDCVECETKPVKLDHIRREIFLVGDLSSEQRLKLLDIANKCPVHRTLSSEIVIKSELK